MQKRTWLQAKGAMTQEEANAITQKINYLESHSLQCTRTEALAISLHKLLHRCERKLLYEEACDAEKLWVHKEHNCAAQKKAKPIKQCKGQGTLKLVKRSCAE